MTREPTRQPLRIRLLGDFELSVGTARVPDAAFRLRKAKSLLKLLALAPDRRMHRERVGQLLWPDRDVESVDNNLHQAVYVARKALEQASRGAGACLLLHEDTLSLESRALAIDVDVHAFQSAAVRAREQQSGEAYAAALELYGGELLPQDSSEPWTTAQRRALKELHVALLLELSELHDAAGQRGAALKSQAFGLATTVGLVSSTGVAGFTLGGGVGWLMRKHGLACDNLVGAEVVTANGELVRTNERENPELLWGLRGGGGNFGVVTSLEFRLHPVGPMITAAVVFYPGERAQEILEFFREFVRPAPDELTVLANLLTAPPAPFLPSEWHGKKIVGLIGMHCGRLEDGLRAVQPMRDLGGPIADLTGPMPYVAMQSLIDAMWGRGALLHEGRLRARAQRRRDRDVGALSSGRDLGEVGDPHPPLRRRGRARARGLGRVR